MKVARHIYTALILIAIVVTGQSALAGPVQPTDANYEWLFDEGTGTTVADTGANVAGKTANFKGTPAWSSLTPFAYVGNNSLTTSTGTTQGNVEVDSFNVNLGTQSTLSLWAYFDGSTGQSGGILFDEYDAPTRSFLYFNDDGTPNSDAVFWESTNLGGTGLNNMASGTWTHFAYVRNGTQLDVYQDGTLAMTGAVPAGDAFFASPSFGGRWNNVAQHLGSIDEVGIWTSALSSDNIAWLSQNSLTESIPEPATMTLLALGGIGILARRRRR
ncbi:MAG: PEP-CTERM sorting domain-containing protein [bacterium]|nr:PEP-CTERM sorting domain-containing protein [bacterium]